MHVFFFFLLLLLHRHYQATDKYRPTVTINVTMPAIVLLNPGDDGSLTTPPTTTKERHDAEYWSHRAIVYRMGKEYKYIGENIELPILYITLGPDEYFYKSDVPSTTSNVPNRPLLGDPNEFEVAQNQWLERQARRRAAATAAATPTTGATARGTVEEEEEEEDDEVLLAACQLLDQ